jgi:hypothetical protein
MIVRWALLELIANDNSSEAAKNAIQEILFDSRNWPSDLIILREPHQASSHSIS